jgi:hypothetical protein
VYVVAALLGRESERVTDPVVRDAAFAVSKLNGTVKAIVDTTRVARDNKDSFFMQ